LTYDIDLENLYDDVINISQETIESITIDRLKDNNDISDWVEKGIELHNEHKSENCEFC
jgi:wobble nucleotide-excising tRNase